MIWMNETSSNVFVKSMCQKQYYSNHKINKDIFLCIYSVIERTYSFHGNRYTIFDVISDRSYIVFVDLITANAAHIVKSPDINIHTHYIYARIQQLKIPAYSSA